MILKETKLLCFTYCSILRHLRNTSFPACNILSTVWTPLILFSFMQDIWQNNQCVTMAWQSCHICGHEKGHKIYLDKEWFIHREEVLGRRARDDLCPLLFYLSCWGIYTAPITVMPEFIRTSIYSYNTQMGWTDYMGYPRSEVWRRSLHKLHMLSIGRRCLLTIPI